MSLTVCTGFYKAFNNLTCHQHCFSTYKYTAPSTTKYPESLARLLNLQVVICEMTLSKTITNIDLF